MQTQDLAFSVTQELEALVVFLAEIYKITPETSIYVYLFMQEWSFYWYGVGLPSEKCLFKMFL